MTNARERVSSIPETLVSEPHHRFSNPAPSPVRLRRALTSIQPGSSVEDMGTRSGARAGLTATVVLAAMAAALAGCTPGTSSTSNTTSPATTTTAASVTPATTAAGSATSAATSAAATTSAPSAPASATATGLGACLTVQLTATLGAGSGSGAGHAYPVLVLTNKGTTSCTVKGYPGVSFVGSGNGTQLGAAAVRQSAGIPIAALTLAPGAAAHAELSITMAGNYDATTCRPKAADGLRVYPPEETHSIFLATTSYTACQNASVLLLVVHPLQAGAA